jgi:hypothetical protein
MSASAKISKRDHLPAPRIELRWEPSNKPKYNWQCHYELVIPLRETDIRREDDNGNKVRSILVVPMGPPSLRFSSSTPCSGLDHAGYCDTPYRDGAHAQWDAAVLGGLPIFVIAPNGEIFPHVADVAV